MNYISHDASGRILNTIEVNYKINKSGFINIGNKKINPDSYYIDMNKKVLKNKKTISYIINNSNVVANGIDTATITKIPTPCEVTLGGTQYQVNDGVFEVSFDLPGVYEIEVEAFPYLPAKFTVEAL